MDRSRTNPQQGGAPQYALPVGSPRQGSVPVVERGIISGDNVQFGRLRRRTRLSQSESQSSGAEEEWLSSSLEAGGSYGRSPVLQGMQAEHVWYSRGAYEQAEGSYQRRLVSGGNGPLSSSPRSPNTRGHMTFHSKRAHGQEQSPSHTVTTVKSSGTPHRQISRGRYRTSSENEERGKGSRGPAPRKRGLSETEGRPRWDKYDASHSGMGETGCVSFGLLDMMVLVVFLSSVCFAFIGRANLCIRFSVDVEPFGQGCFLLPLF